ncbi:hypothetical protein [Negadavirga shengliensis]|uniref:Uncharacterized protein n=1 Tax=Negadavirga shengliensis TaxID=1389218 RepID=A0ABV9T0T6_9BACT
MESFNLNTFKNLAQMKGNTVISIYSPTSRQTTDGYKADKIHLKNQLSEIECTLRERYKMEEEEIETLLQEGHNLLADYEFWKYNADMLASFIADGKLTTYRLPLKLENSIHFVGTRPFLLPLMPELNDDGHFYLLLLNLDRIRLYEVTRNTIQEITIDAEEVAVSFTGEEELDENQQFLQGQGGVGQAGAMFHGHGEGSDEEKKVTILNYFHRMTDMLEPKLNEHPLPLMVAGVDYLVPLFHQASKYKPLLDGHVSGAYNGDDARELHAKAWDAAAPYFSSESKKRKEMYTQKEAEGLALSNDRAKLIKASFVGGVETLFVSTDHKHVWGGFVEEDYKIVFDEKPTGENHCLIDLAAVKVLENKGKVYFLEPEEMPGESQIAGILRYEI